MSEKNISITIPMDVKALIRASDMLHGLADDLANITVDTPAAGEYVEIIAETPPNATAPIPPNAAAIVSAENFKAGLNKLATALAPPAATKEPARIDKPDPNSLDADGIPWDGRIHADSKLRVVRGDTWKLIRGIEKKSPGLVEQVKAELKAGNVAASVPTSSPTGQPPASQQPATVAAVAPTAAEQAFAAQAPTGIDFAGMMEKITPRLAADPKYNAIIQAVLLEFNLPGLPSLLQQAELIPQFDARLDALWQG